MKHTEIIDDASEYGSRGEAWADEFVSYMKTIVTNPIYSGMPDAVKSDGKIQWEAPSNRSGGDYQFTNNKRKEWWKDKAESVGIDTSKDQWISKTAKFIHPTGKKPCKRCGQIMTIGYVYPSSILMKRFKKYIDPNFEVDMNESVHDLIQHAYSISKIRFLSSFKAIFKAKDIQVPDFGGDLDEIFIWLDSEYIPKEPSTLSPGVMSNAPDRFDGFHSFNRCCRGKADKGRSTNNLKSYTTDRRVFEYWSEGNWIAADRLMGLVRSVFSNEATADGRDGPPSADHIGPISLGFRHRPEFKLLSQEANSAKNNRMSLDDVLHLINCEKEGVEVASWYAKPLWNLRKHDVNSDEKALRLSKMLRDNQRNAMHILCMMFNKDKYSFLIYLLELDYADKNFTFKNLRVENFITTFDHLIVEPRTTMYSNEQKARRIRIGFEALKGYMEKDNRHTYQVESDEVLSLVNRSIETLDNSSMDRQIKKLDGDFRYIMYESESGISLDALKEYADAFPSKNEIPVFVDARDCLYLAMLKVARSLSSQWDDNRYVRTGLSDID